MPLDTALDLAIQEELGLPTQTAVQAPAATTPAPFEGAFQDPLFLLSLGSKLLQPRSPAQGQFGFAAQALEQSLQGLQQRRTTQEQRGLQKQQIEAQTEATQAKTAETRAKTKKLEVETPMIQQLLAAQTEAEKAQAQKFLSDAKKATAVKPSAEMQAISGIADALRVLDPEKYPTTEAGQAQALLDAHTLKARMGDNPDAFAAQAIVDFVQSPGFGIATEQEKMQAIQVINQAAIRMQQGRPGAAQAEITGTERNISGTGQDGPASPAAVPTEPVVEKGHFKGFTVSQAQQVLKNWANDPAALETELALRYPNKAVRDAMRAHFQGMIERIK